MVNELEEARHLLEEGDWEAIVGMTSGNVLTAVVNLLGVANAIFYKDFSTTTSPQLPEMVAPLAAAILQSKQSGRP